MKIAIIDQVHECISEAFLQKGWECDFLYEHNREQLLAVIHQYDGIVLRSRIKMDRELLSKATELKFIGRPGAGLENIDTDYCAQREIKVFRSPEGNRDAVAEHIIGMILSLFNHLKRADTEVRDGIWLREANRGLELMGKTIGIIGYGYMGKAFAKRLSGFGVNVIAYDKYLTDYSDDFARQVALEELYNEADIVSIHTPLTEETIGMVNTNFLNQFRKPIFFINSARGKSVVTSDLVDALETGRVLGACLDVLEYESSTFMKVEDQSSPAALEYLKTSNKVVLSPHIAGWTHEAKLKMGQFLANKIVSAFK